jgi:hypothetical protein
MFHREKVLTIKTVALPEYNSTALAAGRARGKERAIGMIETRCPDFAFRL